MPKYVYWIGDTGVSIGPHPSGGAKLSTAMQALRDENVDVVVSLQPIEEAKEVGLLEEESATEAHQMTFFRYPIVDHSTPPFTNATFEFIKQLVDLNAGGKRLFIHCYAGIGRSATIAACVLIDRGMDVYDVLEELRDARGFAVPETQAQFDWISDFAESNL